MENKLEPCPDCGTLLVPGFRHYAIPCLAACRERIARLRAALETARYELRNYTRGQLGEKNTTVIDCIEEIDAALSPETQETKR